MKTITISTDQEYWGERPPEQDEVDSFVKEIETVAAEWEIEIDINIIDGDYSNDNKGQEIIEKAWDRWCMKD